MNLSSSLRCVGLSSSGFSLVPAAEISGVLPADTMHTHRDPETGDTVACDCYGECRDWLEANDPFWALPPA